MPGRLRDDAVCPRCERPIIMIARVTYANTGRVTLDFTHEDETIPDCTKSGEMEDMDRLHDSLHVEVK